MSIIKQWGDFNRNRQGFLNYLARIRKDGGTLLRPDLTQKLYDLNRPLESVTKLMWSAVGAISPRVSGVNTFTQKAYDMTPRTKLYGDELVVNGDFSNGSTGWTTGVQWSIADGVATCLSGGDSLRNGITGYETGKLYEVKIYKQSAANTVVSIRAGVSQNSTASGITTYLLTAGTGATRGLEVFGTVGQVIDNISVREVLTNDLTQTTAASQPDFSRIAPVERGGLMNANGQTKFMSFPAISFGASDAWSVECKMNWNGSNNSDIGFVGNSSPIGLIGLKRSLYNRFSIYNSVGTYLTFSIGSSTEIIGKNKLITFTAQGNGVIKLYIEGVYKESLSIASGIYLSTLLRADTLYSQCVVSHFAIFSKALSPSEVANRSAVLRQIYPEIDSVPIGTQTWAVRNYEAVCTPQGTLIPEVQSAATWATSQTLYDNAYAAQSGTTEQKTYAAVKAAAMWASPNNDAALAAIYGKIYNKFAVKLISMDIAYYNTANPTALWGYDAPTQAQLATLAAAGGNACKAIGTSYWTNANGTNVNGLTLLGTGYRNSSGVYADNKVRIGLMCKDADVVRTILNGDDTFAESAITTEGYCLRLIKV